MQLYRGMDVGTAKLPRPSAAGCRTTCSTSGTSPRRPAWRTTSAGPAPSSTSCGRGAYAGARRRLRALRARGARRPRVPRHGSRGARAARGRARPRSARPRCTRGSRRSTRWRPRRSCRPTGGASSARSRSSRSPARPFTATLPEQRDVYPSVQIGLDVPRPELDARIDAASRADVGGGSRRRGAPPARRTACATASPRRAPSATPRCCGCLDGELTEAEAVEDTHRTTRRFARRQDTWFRRDDRIRWLPHDAPDLTANSPRRRDARRHLLTSRDDQRPSRAVPRPRLAILIVPKGRSRAVSWADPSTTRDLRARGGVALRYAGSSAARRGSAALDVPLGA